VKQRITIDDLNQLTNEQKEKLREWWKPERGDLYIYNKSSLRDEGWEIYQVLKEDTPNLLKEMKAYPLLSIGQMIEILDKNETDWLEVLLNGAYDGMEPCDSLWRKLKSIL